MYFFSQICALSNVKCAFILFNLFFIDQFKNNLAILSPQLFSEIEKSQSNNFTFNNSSNTHQLHHRTNQPLLENEPLKQSSFNQQLNQAQPSGISLPNYHDQNLWKLALNNAPVSQLNKQISFQNDHSKNNKFNNEFNSNNGDIIPIGVLQSSLTPMINSQFNLDQSLPELNANDQNFYSNGFSMSSMQSSIPNVRFNTDTQLNLPSLNGNSPLSNTDNFMYLNKINSPFSNNFNENKDSMNNLNRTPSPAIHSSNVNNIKNNNDNDNHLNSMNNQNNANNNINGNNNINNNININKNQNNGNNNNVNDDLKNLNNINQHQSNINLWKQSNTRFTEHFKPDYNANKFIPNRMQTDDYEESTENEGPINNNINAIENSSFNGQEPNEDDFNEALNNNAINNENLKKKKIDSNDVLLYNKLNILSNGINPKQKIVSSTLSDGIGSGSYYLIFPPIVTNNFEEMIDANLPLDPNSLQNQKRRKQNLIFDQNKASWWQRFLPEKLRTNLSVNNENNSDEGNNNIGNNGNDNNNINNNHINSVEAHFEENYPNNSKNKIKNLSNLILNPNSDNSALLAEIYNSNLQQNIPLPIFQPIGDSPLYQIYQPSSYQSSPYNSPPYNPLPYNHPSYNHPSYNQPSYSQPPYSQPPYSQPPYSQPSYSQPPYNQPSYSQAPYNQPSSYQPPYYSQTPEEPSHEEENTEEEDDENQNIKIQGPSIVERMRNWWKNLFRMNPETNKNFKKFI